MTTALRTVFTEFVNKFDNKELEKGQKNVDKTIGKLKKLGGAMAAAFSVKVIAQWVDTQTEAIDVLSKAAIGLNVTFDAMERLDFIAQRSGVSTDAFKASIQDMNEKLGDAADGSKAGRKALQDLGLSYKDLEKLNEEERLVAIVGALQGVEDTTKRAFIGNKLLGGSFKQLLPLINAPIGTMKELGEEHERLGGGYTKNVSDLSQQYKDLGVNLGVITKTLSGKILERLLPEDNAKIEAFYKDVIDKFSWMVDNTPIIEAGVAAVGTALVVAGVAAIAAWAPFLIIGLKVAALIAAVGAAVFFVVEGIKKLGAFLEKFDIFGKTTPTSRALPQDIQDRIDASRARRRAAPEPEPRREPRRARQQASLRTATPAAAPALGGVTRTSRVVNQTNHTKVQVTGNFNSDIEFERAVKAALDKTHRDARAALGN